MKKTLMLILAASLFLGLSCKQETPEPEQQVREWKPEDMRSMTWLTAERGLILDTEQDTEGYVLFEPSLTNATFLINKEGQVVHRWDTQLNSLNSYLLPNGHLVRLERDLDFPTFAAGGQAGRIREYDWDGNLVWDYELANEKELLHHDIEIMPNGNILGIAYEVVPAEEAADLGRNPEHLPKAGLWLDKVVEIKPTKPEGGEIVWTWYMKDHLVQHLDASKKNYGDPAENPRKIDINFHSAEALHGAPPSEEQIQQMIQMGMTTSNATVDNQGSDITHTNAISYNADLDQIILSMAGLNEVAIIDHSTTTEEAKGSTGGRWGHGGDLLYRWGNPQNYGKGSAANQQLFFQHDVKWIPKGLPGEGHLMVHNNDIPDGKAKLPTFWAGLPTASPPDFAMSIGDVGNYSAIYEFEPPTDSSGAYIMKDDGAFGPDEPVWSYQAPDTYTMYSGFISGAHRLPNGHTLITQGMQGRIIEVTPDQKIVWEYRNPYSGDYRLPDGTFAQPAGPFLMALFRSTLLPADYPAFAGKDLKPLQTQPETFKLPPPPAPAEQ
ncbi:MAG TPA: aryl-sulfate sulfotransferase [Robiginitalea sp.]|nr:aryl-sulfate sulfotransferase [Robiginitalea sp.]